MSESITSEVRGWTRGKLLALDVGLARIGVAVCDPLGLVARPLSVIQRRSRNEDFVLLAEMVTREEAQGVICGLPLNMDGSEGQQAATTRDMGAPLCQCPARAAGPAGAARVLG